VADLVYKNSTFDSNPLVKKLELILDDVLEMVNIKRKPVLIINVNEESESDDEY
jgi:hypothetical protein